MGFTSGNRIIRIICRDPYYAYDAYHITAAFFPEAVRQGLIRQEEDPSLNGLVSIRIGGEKDLTDAEEAAEKSVYEFGEELTGNEDGCAGDDHVRTADRKELKARMGRDLYRALAGYTGRELPWGILTGIRPTKIIRRWLDAGYSKKECLDRFGEDYLVSSDRACLAFDIACLEREKLRQVEQYSDAAHGGRGYCVYIHIPFCPSRCSYCSFASLPAERFAYRIDPYLDALEREMRAARDRLTGRTVSSVYVGGGTPTVLSAEQLERLCRMIRDIFGQTDTPGDSPEGEAPWLEWTIEAGRPDTITSEKLRVMKSAGVTRISINPQSMHDETLRRIGRNHTAGQIREAFGLARQEGLDNINMDLIAGLDGESAEDFRRTLEAVAELQPDSVTVHALAVKRASVIGQERERPLPQAQTVERMSEEARRWAQAHGMKPYYLYRQKNMSGNGENIGFALPGKGCLYNILIMEEVQDILAFGAGAVSKFLTWTGGGEPSGSRKQKIVRVDNVKDVLLYTEQIDEMIKRKEKILC